MTRQERRRIKREEAKPGYRSDAELAQLLKEKREALAAVRALAPATRRHSNAMLAVLATAALGTR